METVEITWSRGRMALRKAFFPCSSAKLKKIFKIAATEPWQNRELKGQLIQFLEEIRAEELEKARDDLHMKEACEARRDELKREMAGRMLSRAELKRRNAEIKRTEKDAKSYLRAVQKRIGYKKDGKLIEGVVHKLDADLKVVREWPEW